MKGIFAAVLAVAFIAAAAAPAAAGQSYTNGQFKYSCTYPDGWKMKEQNTQSELGGADAAMAKKMGFEMPQVASVCFAEKKCNPGDEGEKPEIQLTMMEVQKQKPAKVEKRSKPGEVEKSEKGKDECEVIDKGKRSWAGRSTQFITTRCPEKKKWRYTTTLAQNRAAGKANTVYTLMCTMRSESKDKAESLNEFKSNLKPHCDSNIASAKFLK